VFPGLTPRHDPPRLAVIVAHPDDETFGCGSVLLAAAAAGWRTTVVCATRGEAGEPAEGTDLSSRTLGEMREQELREAAELLGVAEVRLLGFQDSGMEGVPTTDTLVGAPYADVLDTVRGVLGEVDPDAVVTLDAGDGHRDHFRIRDATVDVAGERGTPVYLQCLARSLMSRWAEHMAVVKPDLAHLREADLGTHDDEITLALDSSAHLPTRERAIARHRSQTSPFEGLPDDLRVAFLTRDYLRLVDTPGPR
jgi:LmbE family N-acetylglucosaminyl deacetylase